MLLIRGEPGLGKSSLWLFALDHAISSGYHVASARPARSEARLSYGVLIDLLDGFLVDREATIEVLAAPYQEALTAIRHGTRDGIARAWQVVGAAVLAVLRELAKGPIPLVIAIDDIQWADRASMRVLEFALRRTTDLPIRVIATERVSMRGATGAEPEPLGGLDPELWILEPMLADDLVAILRRRLASLPVDAAMDVARDSGANPFIALEMGRSALEHAGTRPAVGHAPISRRLHRLAADRVVGLDDAGLEVALLASVLARPTSSLLRSAARSEGRLRQGLANAELAGVLELRGDVWSFTHPLLAAAVYDGAAAADRRALHAMAADLTDDPEERAWHLARAVTGPDARAARALSEAAVVASARGAPDSALALLEEALRLTDPGATDDLAMRRVEAARSLLALDRVEDAFEMAHAATAPDVAAATRAEAQEICGSASSDLADPWRALDYLAQALALTVDPRRAVRIAETYADFLPSFGRAADAVRIVRENVERAERTGDAELIARARANEIALQFQNGLVRAGPALADLLELGDFDRVHRKIVQVATWSDRPEIALERWGVLIDRAAVLGDELTYGDGLVYRAELDTRIGNLDRAAAVVVERSPIELAGAQSRGSHVLLIAAQLAVIRGDTRAARAAAQRGLNLGAGIAWYRARHLAALGLLELAHGDAAAAADLYDQAATEDEALLERRHFAWHITVDRIEAQAIAGRTAEALEGLDRLEAQAATWGDQWAIAAAARSRAAVMAACGELAGAADAATGAVERYEGLPYPMELARALLAAGSLHRRLAHRRQARLSLQRAERLFSQSGARLWLERTRAELSRIGGRAPSADVLTPSEAAVADLVAEGRTNAEVAEQLVLTTRTVESHLTQVYAKLGLRSRSELAARRRSAATLD